MTFLHNRMVAVEYVKETLRLLRPGSVWTMIISPDKSVGYYVRIVTEELSAGIAVHKERYSLGTPVITLEEFTQDG